MKILHAVKPCYPYFSDFRSTDLLPRKQLARETNHVGSPSKNALSIKVF